jgi:hypothetical protein
VPMQLSYGWSILKKIDLEILAGVSNDWFVNSRFDNGGQYHVSNFTSANSNFKTLNISGLEGVRLGYDVSNHIQVNLGSSFQHSLFSGLSGTNVGFKPRAFGANYGMKYKF